MTIKEARNHELGYYILKRLQAGRIQKGNVNLPYRLSDEELTLLENEEIDFEIIDGFKINAWFMKSTEEICKLLNRDMIIYE